MCTKCGGYIPPKNEPTMYAGKFCTCEDTVKKIQVKITLGERGLLEEIEKFIEADDFGKDSNLISKTDLLDFLTSLKSDENKK